MDFSRLDWIIFLLTPLLAWAIVFIGKGRSKMGGTYRGYFLAQGQLSTTTVGATYIGANLTFTTIFLLLSEESFKRGWLVLAVPIFWILGTILFVLAYPRLKPHITEGRTLHQALGFVFKSNALRKCAAVWTIIAFVGTVALEFYGGIVLISWTGIPLVTSITIALCLAFIVSAFTMSGGIKGVSVADVFLDLMTLAAAVFLMRAIWPFPFEEPSPINIPTPTPYLDQAIFVASMAVLFLPFQFCTLDSWQRLLAWNQKGKVPGSWLLTGAVVLAVAYCVPIAIGVFVKTTGLSVPATSQPLEAALKWMQLSAGILGLCFAGLAGAMLSTADELLNCTSLSLLGDWWGISFKAPRTSVENERLSASGKFYTAVFAFISAGLALMALMFQKELSQMALAVFSAQVVFAWPLAAALLTPNRAPHFARWAIAAMIIAGVTAIALVSLSWLLKVKDLADAAPVAAFLVAAMLFVPPWIRSRNKGSDTE